MADAISCSVVKLEIASYDKQCVDNICERKMREGRLEFRPDRAYSHKNGKYETLSL